MKKTITIFIISIIIISIILILRWSILWLNEPFNNSIDKNIVLFEHSDNPVYIRLRSWGLLGNHEEILISSTNSIIADTVNDHIFYTDHVYYIIENDSILYIYVTKSSISTLANKMDNVIVIPIDNEDYYEQMSNCQQSEIVKLSIYE